jgi:hypothetical protein
VIAQELTYKCVVRTPGESRSHPHKITIGETRDTRENFAEAQL